MGIARLAEALEEIFRLIGNALTMMVGLPMEIFRQFVLPGRRPS